MRRLLFFLTLLVMLALPAFALADADPVQPHSLLLPGEQLWAAVAGFLAPAFGYVLNYRAPWVSEPVKLFVQGVIAAIAGGITQAITAGNVGFNEITAQYIGTAVLLAIAGHKAFVIGQVNTKLGGGRNIQDDPAH